MHLYWIVELVAQENTLLAGYYMSMNRSNTFKILARYPLEAKRVTHPKRRAISANTYPFYPLCFDSRIPLSAGLRTLDLDFALEVGTNRYIDQTIFLACLITIQSSGQNNPATDTLYA